jgi:hypothetical protein
MISDKELKLQQDMLFVFVPLFFDLLLLVAALFMSGFWRIAGVLMALGFAGFVLWQSRFMFKNFKMLVTPKGITVVDFFGKVVRKLDWKNVEAVAAGYKKTWKLYTYSFYFRVKGEEDLLFPLISREEGVTGRFQTFVKTRVRKRVPVQLVKG